MKILNVFTSIFEIFKTPSQVSALYLSPDRYTSFKVIVEGWFVFLIFVFLWLYLQHMEVPRLGVKSELQLPAYATATAMPDPSCICNPHCSLCQRQILNPLSEVRDQTCILMNTGWVLNLLRSQELLVVSFYTPNYLICFHVLHRHLGVFYNILMYQCGITH